MYTRALKNTTRAAAGIAALLLVVGCANTAPSLNSASDVERAATANADKVVFGKLRLVKNGTPVDFTDGFFANSATLNLYQAGANRKIAGKVGDNGDFSWTLPAGTYHVESVAFRFHGQTLEPETNFTFTVSPEYDATYLGTVALEATFDAGYLGAHGTVDRFTVWDNCKSDCERRLGQLGIDDEASTRSLMRWDYQ